MEQKGFVEIEYSKRTVDWSMTDLHSHPNYELYFLLEGSRRFLFSDKLIQIPQNCVVVIPPFTMHKTEGRPFERINVNLSPTALTAYERQTLDECFKKTCLLFTEDETVRIREVLDEALTAYERKDKESDETVRTLLGYLIFLLKKHENPYDVESVETKGKVPPVVLKIVDYLNRRYAEEISLTTLCDTFYLSKVTLCNYFKKYLNCSVGSYLITLRINKAKELLSTTKLSMEKIAAQTGFSSANYFGLIFKQKVGLSPLHYRAHEKSKT